jgi:hypothetical protein
MIGAAAEMRNQPLSYNAEGTTSKACILAAPPELEASERS